MSSLTFAQSAAKVVKPSSSVVKCFLLSSLNRFCLLFGLCAHVTLVLVFRVRCRCALCASLPGLMSDQPAARSVAPTFSDGAQRHLPATTLQRSFLPSASYQRSVTSPSVSAQQMPPPPVPQAVSTVRSMQFLTSARRSSQSLIGVERSIESQMERIQSSIVSTQSPTNLLHNTPSEFHVRNTPSELADVMVMFQPPYAVQDVVDAELKCAMLTIIDRMCGHDQFHRQCVARTHCKPVVAIAPPEPSTKAIWAPKLSGTQRSYPWILQDEVSELDEQLDSRMRNLWSAPPAFGLPAVEIFGAGKVRGGPLPVLPTSLHSHKMQSAMHQVQQCAHSIKTVDTGVSQKNSPAPFKSGACVQLADSHSTPQATAASQELAAQIELEPSFVAPPSSPSDSGTLSGASEATLTPSQAAADIAQSFESLVAPENEQVEVAPEEVQSVVTPEDAQSLGPEDAHLLAPEDAQLFAPEDAQLPAPEDAQSVLAPVNPKPSKSLTAFQEQQEMQQRRLQAMREKRALKKKKRQKEKKRKQQHQLHLQQMQGDHQDEAQLHKLPEDLKQHENDEQAE